MSSRGLVRSCLSFEYPEKIPVHLWTLPWAERRYPKEMEELRRRYPNDIVNCIDVYQASPKVKGSPHEIGTYTDEWGCQFVNIQYGVIGEVKQPLLADIGDWRNVEPPLEILPPDLDKARDAVNRFCGQSDKFVIANCCPRPWERYQFLRGTVNAMVDVMDFSADVQGFLSLIQSFYLRELEFWASTDVDAVMFMDDWGAQSQLLIPPAAWRDIFKPLYRDYGDIAHSHGKFLFMHSDGHITEIYADLIEVGVDALNSQLFCMDLAGLSAIAKGKITFWGEIDRQHVLPSGNPETGREAVRKVAAHLYDPSGGIIAQLEFGAGAHPAVVSAVFDEWESLHQKRRP